MKKALYIIFAAAFIFSSCEKVIEIDVNDAASQLMIEGVLNDDGNPAKVYISKSVGLSDDNNFPAVNDAVVILSDDAGNTDTLTLYSPGFYISDTVNTVTGRRYTLRVKIGEQTYEAHSVMPEITPFDSLGLDSSTFAGNVGYRWTPYHQDPAVVRNYYRYKFYVNTTADNSIYVDDDQYTDGKYVSRPFFSDLEMKPNDQLTVEMYNIDEAAYMYWYSLYRGGNGPDASATPANPISNFSGGCLGYFSAQRRQVKTVVIP